MRTSILKMFLAAGLLFTFSYVFADAPGVSPTTAVAPTAAVVSAPSAPALSVGGFIQSHGGVQPSIILILLCLNSILSALRDICARLDGVKPGDAAPVGDAKLSMLNKACLVLGKVLDYVMGNPQH